MSRRRRRNQDATRRMRRIILTIVVTMMALGVLWYFTGYSLIMAVYDVLTVIGITIVMLVVMSQFVLPVTTNKDRSKAWQRMVAFMSRSDEPVLVVKDGKVIANRGEDRKSGPGVILVYPGNAVVIQTATSYVDSYGPGVVFLERGQRLRDALELREHVYEVSNANARTRDGIELKADIIVRFMLSRGPDRPEPGNWSDESGPPYYFDDASAFAAVYGGEAVEQETSTRWSDLPTQVAVDLWRELLLGYSLNELFPEEREINNINQNAPYEKIQKALHRRMVVGQREATQIDFGPIERNVLSRRGVSIRSVEIRNVRVPTELQEKFKDQWRYRWQRNANERAASADEEISAKRREGERQARFDYIANFGEAIPNPDLHSDKQILMRLIDQSIDATDRPSIAREIESQLDTIEMMRNWLNNFDEDGRWRRTNL